MPRENPNRVSLILVLATVGLGFIWIGFSKFAVPALIESAYHGQSWPIFNRMISGQASHRLAEYVLDWEKVSRVILLVLFAIGLLIVGIVRPEFQAAFWRPAAPDRDPSTVKPMSRQRILVVYALNALILGGSLFDLSRDKEHWPFSQYPMYAQTEKSRSLTILRLFGVTQQGAEIPLTDIRYLQPFDDSRLPEALNRIAKKRPLQLKTAVRDCLVRYEALRRAGRHDGPPLRAMRLYRVYWVLDPWAPNIDHPDRKDFLVEVQEGEIKEP